jgi:chromosome segregation ATPase
VKDKIKYILWGLAALFLFRLIGIIINPENTSLHESRFIVLLILFVILGTLVFKYKKEVIGLRESYAKLKPLEQITDAEEWANEILAEAEKKANTIISKAEKETNELQNKADENLRIAKDKEQDATKRLQSAISEGQRLAQEIISKAEQQAKETAGEALEAKRNVDQYERAAEAMKNVIKGYGNAYVIPSYSLLDGLAETYGYTQAGEDLKNTRTLSRDLVKMGRAGMCDYAEVNRSNTAINFVVDAFNGKVDSILSRAKIDNYGKLKQEMIDAFNLVNHNGQSFRNARITQEYYNSRLMELELACRVNEIRQRDLEEQRRIKEQIREEEKARREIEKAMRDAAKEEDVLQKAMEKVRGQLEKASEEQRATYEAQIEELEQKWKEAEERNQRAISMAQQTKSGHVYIISNIGSFGEDVYKIGMTRRLEPLDRVKELGDELLSNLVYRKESCYAPVRLI